MLWARSSSLLPSWGARDGGGARSWLLIQAGLVLPVGRRGERYLCISPILHASSSALHSATSGAETVARRKVLPVADGPIRPLAATPFSC